MVKTQFAIRLSAVLMLFFYGTTFSSAQNRNIDSLHNRIRNNIKEDTLKARDLYMLGFQFLEIGSFDSSTYYNNASLKLSEKLDWKKGISSSYGNMGAVCKMQGNYSKAIRYMLEALRIDEETGLKKGIARHLGSIGTVYSNQHDNKKALEYHFRALKINEEIGNKANLASNYGNIGVAYNALKQYSNALVYLQRSLKIQEELGNKNAMAITLGNIGFVSKNLGELEKALEYHRRALKLDTEAGNQKGIAVQTGSIGSVYAAQKKYAEAEGYLLKGLAICDSLHLLNFKIELEGVLKDIYTETGQYAKALKHYKQYNMAKDSSFSLEKSNEITRHQMNYEFEKKETALKAEQEKKEAVAEADKKRQNIFFWLVCFVAVAIGGIALIVFRSLRLVRGQKLIIELQKNLVEEKQREVLDSIHYARRIQTSLMPSEKYIERNLERLKK